MKPNFLEHARELAQEIEAAKNRVRNLSRHWATDGAHKESYLRDVLNARLPARYRAASGFIVTSETQSSQIDILVVDTERPTVGRDAAGNIFVTPDAVSAVIEVKTRLTTALNSKRHSVSSVTTSTCADQAPGVAFSLLSQRKIPVSGKVLTIRYLWLLSVQPPWA